MKRPIRTTKGTPLEGKVVRRAGRYWMRAVLRITPGLIQYHVTVRPELTMLSERVTRRRRFDGADGVDGHWEPAQINWPSIGAQNVATTKAFGELLRFMADLGARLNDCKLEGEWEDDYRKWLAQAVEADKRARQAAAAVNP